VYCKENCRRRVLQKARQQLCVDVDQLDFDAEARKGIGYPASGRKGYFAFVGKPARENEDVPKVTHRHSCRSAAERCHDLDLVGQDAGQAPHAFADPVGLGEAVRQP
jgi:hypothetical protein